MASGPSIVATIGADTAPLKRDLAEAERMVERSADNMERGQVRGFKRLAKTAGASGAFGFLKDVGGAFGFGVGAAGAVGLLIPKLIEVQEEAEKAERAMEKLLGPVQAAKYTSEGALQSRLDETLKSLEALAKAPSISESLWKGAKDFFESMFTDPSGEGLSSKPNADDQTKMLQERAAQIKETIEYIKDEAAAREEEDKLLKEHVVDQEKVKQKQKEISDLLNKEAGEAINNINREKSAEIELGNVRSEQANDRYESEQKFQELAEKGREKIIQDIRDEEAERDKARKKEEADALAVSNNAFNIAVEDELDGPNARRQRKRDQRKVWRAQDKVGRMEGNRDRGGRAPQDIPEVKTPPAQAGTDKLDMTNGLLEQIDKKLAGIFKSQ